ncbi:hypothetical protein CL654_02900 [bacterium]|nr:hypothetical protein [bacterium]|tara:strand:- start:30747 stop:31586 length:840 start_codon:yes stop_codon:yes gene_type:complete
MIDQMKKILRRNKFIVWAYYYVKKVIVFPLRFTSLAPIANTTFPLKDLFNPKKTSIFKVIAPYTLVGNKGLTNVYNLAIDVEEKKIPGNFVECGVWKGGCAAVMASITDRYKSGRTTWYFDSFEGMPPPTEEDARGEGKKGDVESITGDILKTSVHDVEEVVFEKLNLPRDKNIIVKGWFQDTLPKRKKEIGKIALLRLDGDWYESTKVCLEELYDQVELGGYIIIDDYGAWEGCRRAVHEFRDTYGVEMNLKFIGTHDPKAFSTKPPAYFKKTSERKI